MEEVADWAMVPSGSNYTNTWLTPYFSTVFPNGITIGGNGRTLKFNCAKTITNFLSGTATSAQLPSANYVNPVSSTTPVYTTVPCGVNGPVYKNTLAANTVTKRCAKK